MNGQDRRPSPGYLFTLSLAMAGLAASAIGLGSALRLAAGKDPTDALQFEGTAVFAAALLLGFVYRLIFWNKVSPRAQNMVRVFLACVLEVGVLISILAIVFTLKATSAGSGTRLILPIMFSATSAICQIASVTWLLRYRRE